MENCNTCQEEICGCKIKISSNCVVYEGKLLPNIDIKPGDKVEQILSDIDEYLGDINSAINTFDRRGIHIEEFTGIYNMTLSETPLEIVNVFFEGINLPNSAWQFISPNKVKLLLNNYNLTMGSNDLIKVEYKR